jgi:hypothetical protein
MKGDLFSLLSASLEDAGNYDSRKVGRDDVKGLIISTCYTSDMGYETAIIDKNKTYIVERYPSINAAAEGHKKGKGFANNLKNKEVTDVGYGDLIDAKKVKLERRKYEKETEC